MYSCLNVVLRRYPQFGAKRGQLHPGCLVLYCFSSAQWVRLGLLMHTQRGAHFQTSLRQMDSQLIQTNASTTLCFLAFHSFLYSLAGQRFNVFSDWLPDRLTHSPTQNIMQGCSEFMIWGLGTRMVVEKDTYLDLAAKFRSVGHVQRLPVYSKIHCIDCARIDPGGRKALAKFPKDPRTGFQVASHLIHTFNGYWTPAIHPAQDYIQFCTPMRDMLMDCLSIHWPGKEEEGMEGSVSYALQST